MAVIDLDRGMDKLLRQAGRGDRSITVGIHSGDGEAQREDGSGLTALDVATFIHFGTNRSPARPFVTQTFDEQKDRWRALLKRLLRARRPEADKQLAEVMRGDVRNNTPVDTGQTKASVDYKIDD